MKEARKGSGLQMISHNVEGKSKQFSVLISKLKSVLCN